MKMNATSIKITTDIDAKNYQLVLILGAGATYSDSVNKSENKRSPLDKGFFKNVNVPHPEEVSKINAYMEEIYDINILDSGQDSFETVMARIYTDISNPKLGSKAFKIFKILITLFNKRLAETTNDLQNFHSQNFNKIISHYLSLGLNPNNITIITFNQDIQIERNLFYLSKLKKWRERNIFHFPGAYQLGISPNNMIESLPESRRKKFSLDYRKTGISVLKLHGSINWHSPHTKKQVSLDAMFKSDRSLYTTDYASIFPMMEITKESGKFGRKYAFPIIIPPVHHKSAILHKKIHKLWEYARRMIIRADEMIIFGYSCPNTDYESENLLKMSFKSNCKNKKISVINPDTNIVKRFVELMSLQQVYYYRDASFFLEDLKRSKNYLKMSSNKIVFSMGFFNRD